MQEAAHKIELWPIDKLVPYSRNPRKNDDFDPKEVDDLLVEDDTRNRTPFTRESHRGAPRGVRVRYCGSVGVRP